MRSFSILAAIVALISVGCAGDDTGETSAVTAITQPRAVTTTTLGPSPTSTTTSPTPTTLESRPITIMPIGDSITQGSTGWDTYRCYLDQMLRNAEVAFDFVGGLSDPFNGQPYGCPTDFDMDHEGRWGWRADEVDDAVAVSAQSLQPDVALVHLGTNDVLQGQQNSETLADLESLVTVLQEVSPATTILVAQIIPCGFPLCTTKVPALNDGIASLSDLSTDESTVIVVDMETGYGLDKLRDGIHPDAAGDELMASRWMQAMEQQGLTDGR